MCNMYGHGWYEPISGKILRNYMKHNSHSEISLSGAIEFPVLAADVVAISFKPGKPISPTAVECVGELRQCVPYGVDPINGKVLVQKARESDGILRPADQLLIRATWDLEVPTRNELCEWIERHCGKRGDFFDWYHRGLGLSDERGREYLNTSGDFVKASKRAGRDVAAMMNGKFIRWGPHKAMGELVAPEELWAKDLIHAVGLFPNRFWQQADSEDRREKAKYVLGAAGLN